MVFNDIGVLVLVSFMLYFKIFVGVVVFSGWVVFDKELFVVKIIFVVK